VTVQINVDTGDCVRCPFAIDVGRASHDECSLAYAAGREIYDFPWDRTETPDWCPAKEGTAISGGGENRKTGLDFGLRSSWAIRHRCYEKEKE